MSARQLSKGPGLYATFLNIDTPSADAFQSYIEQGLKQLSVFVFEPSGANPPTSPEWFTTKEGGQLQGLDTDGGSTVEDWMSLFAKLDSDGVAIGFVFGGQSHTSNLGPMLTTLNESEDDFASFVEALVAFSVSYIEFDIEGSWATPAGFADQFEIFAVNLNKYSQGSIAVLIGASSPVGTVNGSPSSIPESVDQDFVTANNVFFNVYTYFELEVASVLDDPSPWLPTDTKVDPDRIAFAVTCNATSMADAGQVPFTEFIANFPGSQILKSVEEAYLGFFVWIWWQNKPLYPVENLDALFKAVSRG